MEMKTNDSRSLEHSRHQRTDMEISKSFRGKSRKFFVSAYMVKISRENFAVQKIFNSELSWEMF